MVSIKRAHIALKSIYAWNQSQVLHKIGHVLCNRFYHKNFYQILTFLNLNFIILTIFKSFNKLSIRILLFYFLFYLIKLYSVIRVHCSLNHTHTQKLVRAQVFHYSSNWIQFMQCFYSCSDLGYSLVFKNTILAQRVSV